MPIYEYACATCGRTLEVIHSASAVAPEIHEGCGGSLHRLVSAPHTKVKDNDAPPGNAHSSILRFHENKTIAAEKTKKQRP